MPRRLDEVTCRWFTRRLFFQLLGQPYETLARASVALIPCLEPYSVIQITEIDISEAARRDELTSLRPFGTPLEQL